jgi:thiamine pyrophosphate-dependent acetolactate synthase large subunit-like protein
MTTRDALISSIVHDAPVAGAQPREFWGSDPIAAVLRELGIPFVALVPGSSYRGLHDSIVNYLGNRTPQIVLTIHEENTIHIAQGYAKTSGRMMAAAVHANIGLMRSVMGVYNAWCDRAPILLLGATGPWDATRRRQWIDWIHTSADQGGLIRNITKWDNQPGSVAAAIDAVLRAAQIAQTAPQGPAHVNLEVAMQELKLDALPPLPDVRRYAVPPPVEPAPGLVAAAAKWLSGARNPVILMGRSSRSLERWRQRIALAEKLNAPVLTNLKSAAAFPTDHRLHAAPPGAYLDPGAEKLVAQADVVLSLDWLDLAGTLRQAYRERPVAAKVIQVSCDQHNHRGWSMDHQGLPPVDLFLLCETDEAVPLLLDAVSPRAGTPTIPPTAALPPLRSDALTLRGVAVALEAATRGTDVCYTRLPLGWNGAYTQFRHPLHYIGHDGGAGVGSGPGITVGAGLALKGSGRIPIGLMGDGDFLMGNTAVWTAAHYQIPCLMIVCNNRSFYNDERHQGRMAQQRGRPEENKWIGQRIDDPDIDIAGMARVQGGTGIGPVTDPAAIQRSIEEGLEAVRNGTVCVIDARVLPGYDAPA